MSGEKILQAVKLYKEKLVQMEITQKTAIHNVVVTDKQKHLEHCHSMIDKIAQLVADNRTEKAFRWLGFVQGALWASGIYSISELKNHNHP